MAKAIASHPFPNRNLAYTHLSEIVYSRNCSLDSPEYKAMYERSQGDKAKLWRLRYLGVEEELERAFRYVNPSDENAGTFSIKFAEIILSTCNAYELLTKDLYAKFYNGDDPINILNYLALDLHLELAKRKVSHLAAIGSFPNHPEVNQPF